MMDLPNVTVRFHELYRIINGTIQSKLLLAGIELGIFSRLGKPASAEAVAQALGCHPENTRRLLDGLVACRLVTKDAGRYRNTAETQVALVEGTPTYMGELLTIMMQMQEAVLGNVAGLVKEGPPPPAKETDIGAEETWLRYGFSMANYQRAGLARQAREIVSKLPEFSSIHKMLDLGGGPGIVGIAIVGSHPEMTGVVFDRPAVIPVAEKYIREYAMESRMSVIGGDYMRDAIGEGYDLVWASATFNFAGPNLDTPIQKVYDALNPGGVFISLSDGLTHEGTEPAEYVLNTLPCSLMGQDMGIRQGAIAESMRRAGFATITSRTVDTPMMPMDLDIARKSR
jgi:hypothetical protein